MIPTLEPRVNGPPRSKSNPQISLYLYSSSSPADDCYPPLYMAHKAWDDVYRRQVAGNGAHSQAIGTRGPEYLNLKILEPRVVGQRAACDIYALLLQPEC